VIVELDHEVAVFGHVDLGTSATSGESGSPRIGSALSLKTVALGCRQFGLSRVRVTDLVADQSYFPVI